MKRLSIAFAILLTVGASAQAAELATGEQITTALSGNTVQGSMVDDAGTHIGFFGSDGTIKAIDNGLHFTGKWRVKGDAICFQYSYDEDCWQVKIDGDQVTWIKDDTVDGTGTIVKGNPSNF